MPSETSNSQEQPSTDPWVGIEKLYTEFIHETNPKIKLFLNAKVSNNILHALVIYRFVDSEMVKYRIQIQQIIRHSIEHSTETVNRFRYNNIDQLPNLEQLKTMTNFIPTCISLRDDNIMISHYCKKPNGTYVKTK